MKPFDFGAHGARERSTVVLLHASGSSARQWSALVAELGARFDMHAVDLHGHGTQPAWSGPHALTLADDVALVEPTLKRAGRVHLVGHSYGGAVALKAAALHPAAVASITVFEPVLFRWLFDAEPDSEASRGVMTVAATMRKYLQRGNAYRAAELFLNYWSGPGTWENLAGPKRDSAAVRMRSVLAHFDALFAERLSPADLRRVRRPMLFLSGMQSVSSAQRVVSMLRAALPGEQHEALQGVGHMGPVTHADEVNGRIAGFLGHIGGMESDPVLQRAA